MWSLLFATSPPKKVGFDDVLAVIKNPKGLLINTLPVQEQSYLIRGTMSCILEESRINDILTKDDPESYTIIVYGKNAADGTAEIKYHQLLELGFSQDRVWVYAGGLFEWSLLQEVYGKETFATNITCDDCMRYAPPKVLQ